VDQNDYADRVACAYCVRAAHHPQVSAPLDWREVNEKLSLENFTIDKIMERVKKKGFVG
jgi:bifunctional non-homologous end joining protein LigD